MWGVPDLRLWFSCARCRFSNDAVLLIYAPCNKEFSFCICKNKGAVQRLCFYYVHVDSKDPLLYKYFNPLSMGTYYCAIQSNFVSDLVGNTADRYPRGAALMIMVI